MPSNGGASSTSLPVKCCGASRQSVAFRSICAFGFPLERNIFFSFRPRPERNLSSSSRGFLALETVGASHWKRRTAGQAHPGVHEQVLNSNPTSRSHRPGPPDGLVPFFCLPRTKAYAAECDRDSLDLRLSSIFDLNLSVKAIEDSESSAPSACVCVCGVGAACYLWGCFITAFTPAYVQR